MEEEGRLGGKKLEQRKREIRSYFWVRIGETIIARENKKKDERRKRLKKNEEE